MKVSATVIKVILLAIVLPVLASRVSKKKYQEAITRAASEKSALESELATAKDENSRLQGQMSDLEQNLNMKSEEIVSLSEQIKKNNAEISALKNSIKEVFETYDSDDFSVEERNGKLYLILNNKILFASGRETLKKESEEMLASLAEAFKKNPGMNIFVEGHTDNEPIKIQRRRYKDNWSLSVARALNVVRELEENGVSSSRMTASGKGDTLPIASNDSKEGRETNRRTEFIVAPQIEGLYKMYKSGFDNMTNTSN